MCVRVCVMYGVYNIPYIVEIFCGTKNLRKWLQNQSFWIKVLQMLAYLAERQRNYA